MEKDFTIMIPTRHRPVLLNELLKSIYDSTINKDKVEIHVVYDSDDNSTLQYLAGKQTNYIPPISTTFHTRERSQNINNDYYNWIALNFATGKYLIAVNDDTLFEMYGWDDRAINVLNKYEELYPDGIVFGMPEDYERETKRNDNNWMPCFPLISKKAIEVLGYFFDPEMIRDGADWAIAATYKNIDRVVDLRNCIIIKHISTRSGRRHWDQVDEDSRKLDAQSPPANSFIERNSKKLLDYIKLNYIKNE
jgi:hypothetical protein